MMLLYPLAAYASLWLNQPLLVISYLMLLLLFVSIEKYRNQHWYSGSILLFCITLIFYFIQQSYIQYIHFLPPILILFSLFILFSQSLTTKQIPLISRYAELLGDKHEDRHLHYYRKLTLLWSGFFLFMTVTSILLAVFSSVETWSFFTYVISYLLVAIFFITEFIYRKRHFSGEIEGSFFQFIRKIIKIRPHTLTK